MKQNLLIFLASLLLVVCASISVFILSLIIWAILGIGFLASFLLTIGFSGISVYFLYKKILNELKQIEIDLDIEEDDEF